MLSDDLPTLEVSVSGVWKDIVKISKPGKDDLNIYVGIRSKDVKDEELGIYVREYISLEYGTNQSTSFKTDSLEQLFEEQRFLETLRKLL